MEALTTTAEFDWSDKRREAEESLADLRRKRGVALLEGRSFDDREITKAESLLDALQVAEVETARRAEQERTIARINARREVKSQLLKVHEQRLKAVEDAENSVVGLMLALKDLMQTSVELGSLATRLGHRVPLDLLEASVKQRASFRIISILYGVTGRKFGVLTFPAPGNSNFLLDGSKKSDGWVEVERSRTEAAILSMVNED